MLITDSQKIEFNALQVLADARPIVPALKLGSVSQNRLRGLNLISTHEGGFCDTDPSFNRGQTPQIFMQPISILPPEPFKALIFDCDGTLADTMPTHVKAWVAAYQSFGVDITEQPFFDMSGLPNRAIIETLNQQLGINLEVEKTQGDKEQRFMEMLHTIEEIKAVADIARATITQKSRWLWRPAAWVASCIKR